MSSPDEPRSGLLLVMHGVLTIDDEDERGPGNVIGQWERLDEIRVVAQTDVRLVTVDRADWEAAQTG
ncbi:MAG TPA: hypothetical protein VHV52_12715 [Gaiellaceae bacterium]|nr:hypothetical protein [Gaiellaceae bacterium]